VYSEPKGDMMCMFEGHVGGVTHLKFSLDGTKLFSGGRKVCIYHKMVGRFCALLLEGRRFEFSQL